MEQARAFFSTDALFPDLLLLGQFFFRYLRSLLTLRHFRGAFFEVEVWLLHFREWLRFLPLRERERERERLLLRLFLPLRERLLLRLFLPLRE